MKKHIFYCITISKICSNSYSVSRPRFDETLEQKAFNAYFNPSEWSKRKQDFNQYLLDQKINTTVLFKNKTFKGLDFSNLYLKDRIFEDSLFEKINFSGADLRGTKFENCEFINCDLTGAILYYPDECSVEEVRKKGFKVPTTDGYTLVKFYSDLMNKIKEGGDKDGSLSEKAKCLNNLFSSLRFDLKDKDLKKLNLTHINFQGANLYNSQLQGAWITSNIEVPQYTKKDTSKLFDKWVNGGSEEQAFYQSLVNGGFDLFQGVDHDVLCRGIESKKNLCRAHLMNANLAGAVLSGADLQGANLIEANLAGADFTNTNFQRAYLMSTNLASAVLSGAKLQRAYLSSANLARATLMGVDLQDADLSYSKLKGVDLTGAKLRRVYLQGAWITESIQVPNYSENNKAALRDRWMNGTHEEQSFYQSLVDGGFEMK